MKKAKWDSKNTQMQTNIRVYVLAGTNPGSVKTEIY